ncbi:hypothetical protein HDV00_009387 [Rhizophlyctis rosea]|nr:hypothetical protein HDV00_009387 [Rhizophlyctis rosea]
MATLCYPGAGANADITHVMLHYIEFDTVICFDGLPDSKYICYCENCTKTQGKLHDRAKFIKYLKKIAERIDKLTFHFSKLDRTLIYFMNTLLPLPPTHPAYSLVSTANAYYLSGFEPTEYDVDFSMRNQHLSAVMFTAPWNACIKALPPGVEKFFQPTGCGMTRDGQMKRCAFPAVDATGWPCHWACRCQQTVKDVERIPSHEDAETGKVDNTKAAENYEVEVEEREMENRDDGVWKYDPCVPPEFGWDELSDVSSDNESGKEGVDG